MANNNIETDVEILKRDVDNIHSVLSKLDSAIDKIADVSNGINKILAVHDSTIDTIKEQYAERIARQDEDVRVIHERITKHEQEFQDDVKAFHGRIDEMMKKMDERITTLEKWKWYVMGTAWGIGFLLATILQSANVLTIFQ
jgi:peptidoglycan hydrolase CwlO-like protein